MGDGERIVGATVYDALRPPEYTDQMFVERTPVAKPQPTPGRIVLVTLLIQGGKVEVAGIITGVFPGPSGPETDIFAFPSRALPRGVKYENLSRSESGDPEPGRWRFSPRVP